MHARLLGMLAVSPGSVTSSTSCKTVRGLAATATLRSPPRSPDDLLSVSELLRPHATRLTAQHNTNAELGDGKKRGDGSNGITNMQDTVWDVPVHEEEKIAPTGKAIEKVKVSKGKKRTSKRGAGREQGTITGTKITKPRTKDADKACDEPLGLDSALPRRLDWTPPKPRVVDLIDGSETPTQEQTETGSLKGILGSFGFAPDISFSSTGSGSREKPGQQPPLKKRRLDMVEPRASTNVTVEKKKAPKEKAPRKKAQTITELATRSFLAVDEVTKPSLMEGFLSQIPSKGTGQDEDGKLAGVLESKRGRGGARSRTKKDKSTKSRLLSPEKAIVAAESQELLFGTSSQLVREDSPSFIRDLQYALRESEASASQEESVAADQTLWNAATRNLDGSLLEAETVDLTNSPQPVSTRKSSNQGPFHTTAALLAPQQQSLHPESGLVNEENPPLSAPACASPALGLEDDSRISLPKSMAEAACLARPRSQSPIKKKSRAQKPAEGAKDGVVDFNTWTVAELSKKIKAYGFKPVKKKAAMVALLEKCKASTDSQAFQPFEADSEKTISNRIANKDSSDQMVDKSKESVKSTKPGKAAKNGQTGSPKKRGRPRKADTKVQEHSSESKAVHSTISAAPSLEALPDVILVTSSPSDQSTVKTARPEPLSGRKAVVPAAVAAASTASATSRDIQEGLEPTPRLSSVSTAPSAAPVAAPSDPNARLLDAITRAITSFPPTHDPRRLTWYEKMLMYDPIVLEDLAIWLNTEGLGRVGVDEEVWPALVRQWCEERSICCLWRENLRGGKRSRF